MSESEKINTISYHGKTINMFSDDQNDYVSLTDLATAWKGRKSIGTWIKSKQTLEFLAVWEKRYNEFFNVLGFEDIMIAVKGKNFSMSVNHWVDKTKAIGIRARTGTFGGTFAHKDIALKFASWLSPEFELFLIDEIQRLKKLEEQKYSLQLLTHEQVLALVKLKEVFRYVVNQVFAEEANRDIFVAKSGAKNPYKEFNKYRNQMLNLKPDVINERIKEYCRDNNIALTGHILNKTKREKILMLDTYEAVRNAVWDFLEVKGEINSLNLANLVGQMIRIEKGDVFRENTDNLFQTKQSLGEYTELEKYMLENSHLKSAREVISFRKQLEDKQKKQLSSPFSQLLKAVTSVPTPPKEKE